MSSLSRSPNSIGDESFLLGLVDPPKLSIQPTTTTTISSKATNNYSQQQQPPKRSWSEFVKQVPYVVQQRKENDITPGSHDDPICALLRNTTFPKEEWERYAHADPSRPYTRNLIATDRTTYTLLLLCWRPDQESPIHNHPCDGCWLKVLQGSVEESRYDTHTLECTSHHEYTSTDDDTVSYITDAMGYHKIGNSSCTDLAVTLHIYAPPIQTCQIWGNPKELSLSASSTCGGNATDTTTTDSDGVTEETFPIAPLRSCPQSHYSEFGRILER